MTYIRRREKMNCIRGFLIFVAVLVPCLALGAPSAVTGQADLEEAMQTVRAGVEEVLQVLRDPAFKKNEKAARKKIRAISLEFFDYVEMSRRTLGLNWNKLNLEQRKEFVSLFTDLLEDTYVDRILAYSDEKVNFTRTIPLTGKTAEVRTHVVTRTGQVPINYRAVRQETGWRVYDVVIEGVSLVSNYRTQFREILAKDTPEGLLKTLRKRVGRT
jgi:phospholipid transport system substrate-binding protein